MDQWPYWLALCGRLYARFALFRLAEFSNAGNVDGCC